MFLKILECINMLAIAYQDFKYRAIHWLLFLTLAILFAIDGIKSQSIIQYGIGVAFNVVLIILQFSILFLIYSIKGKSLNNLLNRTIGTGDIVFILTLTLAFSWQNFLFYYIAGMIFAILIWTLIKMFSNSSRELIPFAGLMSFFCFIIFLFEMNSTSIKRFSNELITRLING